MKTIDYDLEERTAIFGEAAIEFCLALSANPVTAPIINQLVRAGTSIGANYCEADDAESKKDFRHKIGICRKEARETKYWLRMIAKAVPAAKLRALERSKGASPDILRDHPHHRSKPAQECTRRMIGPGAL